MLSARCPKRRPEPTPNCLVAFVPTEANTREARARRSNTSVDLGVWGASLSVRQVDLGVRGAHVGVREVDLGWVIQGALGVDLRTLWAWRLLGALGVDLGLGDVGPLGDDLGALGALCEMMWVL